MLVHVREVIDGVVPYVVCETAVGPLTARWKGERAPEIGTTEHIELDAGGSLVWAPGRIVAISTSELEHSCSLPVVVEGIEDDLVFLRCHDSIVTVEVSGTPPLPVVGSSVDLVPAFFEAWPIDL